MLWYVSYLFLCFLGAVAAKSSVATEFYISPTGDDVHGKGTQASPWASVAHAQEQVRALRKDHGGHLPGNVTVTLLAGMYFLDEPLVFIDEDSGEGPDAMVTYRAEPGQVIRQCYWNNFYVHCHTCMPGFEFFSLIFSLAFISTRSRVCLLSAKLLLTRGFNPETRAFFG